MSRCKCAVLMEESDEHNRIAEGTNYFKFLKEMPRTSDWLTYREMADKMGKSAEASSSMLVDLTRRGAVETCHDSYPKKWRISDRGIEALIKAGEIDGN